MLGKMKGRRRRGPQRMRWLLGWYHQLNGQGSEQTPGDGEGQGSVGHCSPGCGKELDPTW